MNQFMKKAIEEAKKGIAIRDGGPFGAVIVKNNKIIAFGHNKVISSNDPTAHAEIVAIREASSILQRFDLSDCELYTTCEPCPMCYSAIHWAKITKVYYGATRNDAKNIGFDDQYLYDVLSNKIPDTKLTLEELGRKSCLKVFNTYAKDEKRTLY